MRALFRRSGVYGVAFLLAIVMNFALPRLMPGSPVDSMIAQLGRRATPAAIEAIKARFGLIQQPLWSQFLDYIRGLAFVEKLVFMQQVIGADRRRVAPDIA